MFSKFFKKGNIMINNTVAGDCAGRDLYINQSNACSTNGDIVGAVFENNELKLSGKNISIKNGKITVDGKIQNTKKQYIGKIIINGDVKTLEVDNCDSVTAKNVTTLKSISGDVYCDDILGNVETVSGDVTVKSIKGNVSTISGNILK